VAIVRPQPDPEIESLQNYLLGMGLVSQNFDQANLTAGMLQGFELVIWDDLGLATNRLAANTVDVLSQVYSSGTPLYLVGEHLSSTTSLLPSAQQMEWTNLTQLSPFAGVGGDGTIQIDDLEGLSNLILFGQFGTIDSFSYPARIELVTNLESNAEVLCTSAGASVLTILPGFASPDQSDTRLVRQNMRVVPPDVLGATNTLRALFQNAVCWLTRCQSCSDSRLGLTGSQGNDVVQTGQTIDYYLSAYWNGECPPTGVVVTNQLPTNFKFVSATAQQGTWGYDAVSHQVLFFIGVMPNAGTVGLSISAVALQPGTYTNTAVIRYNSTTAPAVLEPGLVTTVLPNTNAISPVLTLLRSSGPSYLLQLSAGAMQSYKIQTSTDLLQWVDWTNVQGPFWVGALQTNFNRRFYRALGQ
jgi:uncharacterized repeat protein (TIGR01451 family)